MERFVLLLDEVDGFCDICEAAGAPFVAEVGHFAGAMAGAIPVAAAVYPADMSAAAAFVWWEPGGALLLRWLCAPPGDFHCRSRGGGLDHSGRFIERSHKFGLLLEGWIGEFQFTLAPGFGELVVGEVLAAKQFHADSSSSKLNPIAIGLDNRATINGRYVSSRSIKMTCLCSLMAASPVVPEPANGSNTVPPGGVTRRTSQRMRSTGLTVGWLVLLWLGRSALGALGWYLKTGKKRDAPPWPS